MRCLLLVDLSKITLPDAVKSVLVTIAIIFAVWEIYKKGKEIWTKMYNKKHQSDDFQSTVSKHDTEIKDVKTKIDAVATMMDTLFEINKIQTRHTIVNACTEAIEKGYIDQLKLQSLEEMYSMYTEVLKGNSYVSTLVLKVRKLDVRIGE